MSNNIPDIAKDYYEFQQQAADEKSAELGGTEQDIDRASNEARQYILHYQKKYNVDLLADGAANRERVREVLRDFCQDKEIRIKGIEGLMEIVAALEAAIFDFGPLTEYLIDERVEEIQVNTPKDIRVIVKGIEYETGRTFASPKQLETIAGKMAMLDGKRLAPDTPFVDVKLGERIRAALVHDSVSIAGCNITIRKQRKEPILASHLVVWGTLSPEMDLFLKATRDAGLSHIFAGGTGTGKTGTMAAYIRESKVRKISIADTDEMALLELDEHGRTLNQALMWQIGQYASFQDGVKATLRHTPHMVILQEMRDGVCKDVMDMAGTDHQVYVSAHSLPDNLPDRILDLYMQSKTQLSEEAILRKFATSFRIAAQMEKYEDGSKKMHSISELRWEGGGLKQVPIYKYELERFDVRAVYDAYLGREVERAFPVGRFVKAHGISDETARQMKKKRIDEALIARFRKEGDS